MEHFVDGIERKQSFNLADHSSFKIGGNATNVYLPASAEEVARLVKYFKQTNQQFFVLGNGTNVLFPDRDIRLPIILMGDSMSACSIDEHTGEVVAEAGISLLKLVNKVLSYSLTGLEFAHYIPGTFGGALYMNAGAFNGEMSDVVEWVEYVDENGDLNRVSTDGEFFAYRYSKTQEREWVIVRAGLRLSRGDSEKIRTRMVEIESKRKEKQPLDYPSAGSVFKRPEGSYASKLIDEAGLKGDCVGGACVSEKHAGFIVNKGGATAKDVKDLIEHVQQVVLERHGVRLEREIIFVEE